MMLSYVPLLLTILSINNILIWTNIIYTIIKILGTERAEDTADSETDTHLILSNTSISQQQKYVIFIKLTYS